MRHLHPSDRLTAEDAAFLYLESKEMPLHVGSVSILDSEMDLDEYIQFIESKLPLFHATASALYFRSSIWAILPGKTIPDSIFAIT